jgi:hypothetical protein
MPISPATSLSEGARPSLEVSAANRLFDGAPFAPQLARAPVQRAQTVQDRTPNTELGIAAELDLLGGVEFGKGIHQANHARGEEVFDVDMLG